MIQTKFKYTEKEDIQALRFKNILIDLDFRSTLKMTKMLMKFLKFST